MKAIATEIILSIGVLIAVGITVFQLRGIYIAQQELGEEEVVSSFAKDLEAIVDRAIATTGDVAFVYYPSIKQYRIEIENNVVKLFDKISGKQSSFSRALEIVENRFEDCEKILLLKKDGKIVLMCKCLEFGEFCADSLLCCSGYCNQTSKKCEEAPICPSERICVGAQEVKKDSLGRECCPFETPICTKGHCCPLDKPKWCEAPKEGKPRCMSEIEYNDENVGCKKATFVILFVQMNTQVPNFNSLAQKCKNAWVSLTPLSKCPWNVEAIAIEDKICRADECNAFEYLLKCVDKWGYGGKYTRIVGVKHGSSVCGVLGYTLKNYEIVVTTDSNIEEVCSHELGHTFGLCDEGYGNSLCPNCPSTICNTGRFGCSGVGHCCPNTPEQNSIMCSFDYCGRGCSYGNRFGQTSYAHLERELSNYCR
ncbi:MAG: hypothetical protein QW040_00400 [Candidatus Aenigmatarchaeota archaeon]